jgi:hypothetical protein
MAAAALVAARAERDGARKVVALAYRDDEGPPCDYFHGYNAQKIEVQRFKIDHRNLHHYDGCLKG